MTTLLDVLQIVCLAIGATVLYVGVMGGFWVLVVHLVRMARHRHQRSGTLPRPAAGGGQATPGPDPATFTELADFAETAARHVPSPRREE